MGLRGGVSGAATHTTQKQAMPEMTCSMPSRPLMQEKVEFWRQHSISSSVDGSTRILPTAHTPEREPSRM